MAWTNSPRQETWTVEKSHPVSIAIRVEDRLRNDIAQTADRMWLTVRSDSFKLGDDTDSTALIAVESGPPIINPRGYAFLLTIQADQLDLDPEEMYWYDITYSRDDYPLSILKGRFIVAPNVTNRAEEGADYEPDGNIYEYVAVLHNQSLLNVTASLPLPLQGVEGFSTFTTTGAISPVVAGSATVSVASIASGGRTLQENDLLISSHASSTGWVGRITSLNFTGGTLTTATVVTAFKLQGPVGPQGIQGPQGEKGPAGLEPVDMVSTDVGNLLSVGTDGKLAVLPTVLLSALPIGSMLMWPNDVAPPGWLFCRGQQFLASTYPALAAVVGTTWGGTTGNPRVPDMRRRTAVGLDPDGGSPNLSALNTEVGSESKTLGVTEIPSHSHTLAALTAVAGSAGAHTHSINHTHASFNSGTESGHTHSITPPSVSTGQAGGHRHNVPLYNRMDVYTGNGSYDALHNSMGSLTNYPTSTVADHAHTVSIPPFTSGGGSSHQHSISVPAFSGLSGSSGAHTHNVSIPGGSTGSIGGGSAFNLRGPQRVVNYIIKAV